MADLEKASVATVRRASGRLLRAHRTGIIKMKNGGEIACVETITRAFVHHATRKTVMGLWKVHGADILGSGVESKVRRHNLDDRLDELVASELG